MQLSQRKVEKLSIEVGLSTTNINNDRPLKFAILVNGITYIEDTANKEKAIFTFSVELQNDSDQLLEIKLIDKNKTDTLLSPDGSFVKDILLNIDSVSFDNINLGTLLWSHSTFTPDDSTFGELTECVNLGHNGSWKLPFESPVIFWLLENM